jgi:hypothetical protein
MQLLDQLPTSPYLYRYSKATSMKLSALILLLLWTCSPLSAQEGLDSAQVARLAAWQLEWVAPDTTYRWLKPARDPYYATDFSLYIRKEGLEIRYLVEAVDTTQDLSAFPHLRAGQLAVNLADNSEDSHISGHQLHADSIRIHYRADWAQQFTFRPKAAFSEYRHCQMIALFRAGVARAFIFLLFDDAPISLPERKKTLRFVPLAEELVPE